MVEKVITCDGWVAHSSAARPDATRDRPGPAPGAEVVSFQLQPAHFPEKYAAAIVETQEMKQDIQVAEQENKTKVGHPSGELMLVDVSCVPNRF